MKKLLLLLASGSIALATNAQQLRMSVAPVAQDRHEGSTYKSVKNEILEKAPVAPKTKSPGLAYKTTADPRWYSYINYYDTILTYYGGTGVYGASTYLWWDTSAIVAYNASPYTFQNNNMVSYASVFHPQFTSPAKASVGAPTLGFNSPEFYEGLMKITPSDAYSIDSIITYGWYELNPASYAAGYVDTLFVKFVYGTGTASSATTDVFSGWSSSGTMAAYGADPLRFVNMRYDSVRNMTSGMTASATQVYLIDTSKWDDTLSNGLMPIVLRINNASGAAAPLSIPANNMVGVSITFRSGNTSFPASPAFDTVARGGNNYKYNMFRPWLLANGTGSGSSVAYAYAKWDSLDRNQGLYKHLPNYDNGNNVYIPHWGWNSGGSAAGLQYPAIDWKVTCATCGVVTTVKVSDASGLIKTSSAFPNPANNELNIPFTLGESANVTVTLSNIVGQTVATRFMSNVVSGKAVFNTVSLPAGVYTYTVLANGERTTGRAVIAH